MRKDSRLSRMLHALIHMEYIDGPVTSETLASMLHTNPVVVRRTMKKLKDHNYVNSIKGHGGGWTLSVPLCSITLLDIHHSLGEMSLFNIGLSDKHTNCSIEKAINREIEDALFEAEQLVLNKFKHITLDKLAVEFKNSQKND